jgi:cysteinyl-tRNA synthetase
MEKFVSKCKYDFNSALNDDFNTSLAMTVFYKLIKEINSLAAEEKITQTMSKLILPEFERMMDVLGIQIIKVSNDEENEIKQMIKKRDECREQKNFEEADGIRVQIAKKNIVFADHKNKTIWIKQEKIKAE